MSSKNRQIQGLAQFFRILGDPSRLQLLTALAERELNVTQLCKKLHMSQPTVSRHLSILKMSAIAEARRDGKEIYYSIDPAKRRTIKSLIERGASFV